MPLSFKGEGEGENTEKRGFAPLEHPLYTTSEERGKVL